MILPDDKNPTIVWDKERKCWTNTEGGGEEVESFKPPPKMSDMGMGGGPAGGGGPGAGGPPLPPPGLSAGPPSLPAVAAPTFMEPTPSQSIDYTAAPAQPEWLPVAPLPAPSPGLAPSPAPAAAPAAAAAAPGGAQPKLQSNMFKMQRNRSRFLAYFSTGFGVKSRSICSPEELVCGCLQSVGCSHVGGTRERPGADNGAGGSASGWVLCAPVVPVVMGGVGVWSAGWEDWRMGYCCR